MFRWLYKRHIYQNQAGECSRRHLMGNIMLPEILDEVRIDEADEPVFRWFSQEALWATERQGVRFRCTTDVYSQCSEAR